MCTWHLYTCLIIAEICSGTCIPISSLYNYAVGTVELCSWFLHPCVIIAEVCSGTCIHISSMWNCPVGFCTPISYRGTRSHITQSGRVATSISSTVVSICIPIYSLWKCAPGACTSISSLQQSAVVLVSLSHYITIQLVLASLSHHCGTLQLLHVSYLITVEHVHISPRSGWVASSIISQTVVRVCIPISSPWNVQLSLVSLSHYHRTVQFLHVSLSHHCG